jgi:Skp family chaperone for outer membrane proteins
MRDQILDAVVKHAKGQIAVHKTNVDVYLKNPAGIGEHSDITEAVIAEVEKIAHYDDVLEMIGKYFPASG